MHISPSFQFKTQSATGLKVHNFSGPHFLQWHRVQENSQSLVLKKNKVLGGNWLDSVFRVLTWCALTCVSVYSQSTYQRMLSMLAQCEFTMEKSVQVHAMNLCEQDSYEKLTKDIGKFSAKCLFSLSRFTYPCWNLWISFVCKGPS